MDKRSVYPIKMDSINKEFGRLLKEKRGQVKLTQDELATKVGLVRTSITNIEQGRQPISLQMLYQLADALQTSPHKLLPTPAERPKLLSPEIERNLTETALDDEEKDWVRRIVLKTTTNIVGKQDGNS